MRPMARKCVRAGCGNQAEAGRSKCAGCAAEAEVRNQGRAWRDYGTEWQRIRKAFIEKHPNCSIDDCPKPTKDVDHVVSLRDLWHRGPAAYARRHEESNLRALCHEHHSSRTAIEQSGWGRTA